jgi:hypothetical protein
LAIGVHVAVGHSAASVPVIVAVANVATFGVTSVPAYPPDSAVGSPLSATRRSTSFQFSTGSPAINCMSRRTS